MATFRRARRPAAAAAAAAAGGGRGLACREVGPDIDQRDAVPDSLRGGGGAGACHRVARAVGPAGAWPGPPAAGGHRLTAVTGSGRLALLAPAECQPECQ
eukprot:SAG22_NODE_2125_length_2972_cov_36.467804_1_plen_100_part_00